MNAQRHNMMLRQAAMGVVLVALMVGSVPGWGRAEPPPDNGVVRERYPNGRVRLEVRYKHGRIVRKRAFYRNGRLMHETRFKNDRPVVIRNFYENGRLKSRWTDKTKEWVFYDETGRIKSRMKTAR